MPVCFIVLRLKVCFLFRVGEKAPPFETAEEPVYTYTEPGYDEEVQPQSEDKPESAETDAKQEADFQPEYNEADRHSDPAPEPVSIETSQCLQAQARGLNAGLLHCTQAESLLPVSRRFQLIRACLQTAAELPHRIRVLCMYTPVLLRFQKEVLFPRRETGSRLSA